MTVSLSPTLHPSDFTAPDLSASSVKHDSHLRGTVDKAVRVLAMHVRRVAPAPVGGTELQAPPLCESGQP